MEIPNMSLTRLKINNLAMSEAKKRLETSIEKSDTFRVYASIGELLMWVITTEEWHREHIGDSYEERRNDDSQGVILRGVRHAYNMMKHNMDFVKIHKLKPEMKFPVKFPFSFSSVVWIDADNLLNGKNKKQTEYYIKYIEGKDVMDIFNQVQEFLERENNKYLN